MLTATRWVSLTVLGFLLLGSARTEARPVHKKSLGEHFGPFLANKLNDCRTCHVPDPPGTAKEELPEQKPHNPFGVRVKEVKEELRKAGKKTDIATRIETIANEDSDGDGVANLVELLTGHFPGDPQDKSRAAEVAESSKTIAEFRKYLSSYRWRPFETVQRPPVPALSRDPKGSASPVWARNPIDAFIAAEHQQRGLKPRPEAPKHLLLRRVYLDLIGLPPTREELHAFLADQSPDAYEKVVDKLLASPRYGERWGRHWMDIWRYSDWAGYGMEVRDSHRHIWRWRDWIIESVNQDKGYDRMILEMLAGDELAPDDPDTLRATGYLVRNWYLFNRNVWLQNSVEHTSKAFLGVTLNCARCHDHFFDTISQQEYFEFRAFFEPHKVRIDRLPGQPEVVKDGLARVYDADLNAPTLLFVRGDELKPDKNKTFSPGVPAALGGPKLEIEPVRLPFQAYAPDKREFVLKETIAANEANIAKAREALAAARRTLATAVLQACAHQPLPAATGLLVLEKAREQLTLAELDVSLAEARHDALVKVIKVELLEDGAKKDSPEWVRAATETAVVQRQLAVLEAQRNLLAAQQALRVAAEKKRPELVKKLEEAEKALAKADQDAKAAPSTAYAKRNVPSYPATSTGRRLALARWIADRENPLTARVAMNHIWLRHFGKAIVPSVFDFGRNGQLPTHPALLDWLAAEFMTDSASGSGDAPGSAAQAPRGAWSMKKMHRLIVTSSTYRMDSSGDAANAAIDPDNRYLWRMNQRRMEAELVRDSVLHVAGQLDLTMGGPDLDQNLGLTSPRRSVYFRHAAEKQVEFLALFDAASVNECYERPVSIVPQQALALANSSLVQTQSRLLARKLAKDAGDKATPDVFIVAAFEQVLGRKPTAEEQAECEKFLKEQTALLAEKKKLTAFAGPASPVPPAAQPEVRARENLVHVLLNHHDFVTIR